jgi:hypothetical protein
MCFRNVFNQLQDKEFTQFKLAQKWKPQVSADDGLSSSETGHMQFLLDG